MDSQLRAALLDDEKCLREQAIVTAAVGQALAELCDRVQTAAEPDVLELASVRHLRTLIHGELTDPGHTDVLDLVDRLHPTPAVGGCPSSTALRWQADHEPFDRGWYAAPLGWSDSRGDGEFVVALRSALVSGNRATIYAGSGIVAGSQPRIELAETGWKLRPMLTALGIAEHESELELALP